MIDLGLHTPCARRWTIPAKTVAVNDAVNFDRSYVQVASLFLHKSRVDTAEYTTTLGQVKSRSNRSDDRPMAINNPVN